MYLFLQAYIITKKLNMLIKKKDILSYVNTLINKANV